MSIAGPTVAYLKSKGASIVGETSPARFGDTINFLNASVVLDCLVYYSFIGESGFDLVETFRRMFYESIRARVQATLVPAGHCTERIATVDSVEANGNSIKVRMVKHRKPMGQVVLIGDEVYGIVGVHELATRQRLLLDRPAKVHPSKGTQLYGVGVATNPPFNSFKGVTIVSAPGLDAPAAKTELDTYEGMHVRTLRTPEGGQTRCVIETLFGMIVDSTTASLR